MLNDYFRSVFTRENADVLPEEQPMLQPMEHLETLQVTTPVILKKLDALNMLKAEKSPRADNLASCAVL